MDNVKDSREDTREDVPPDSNPLTSGDNPAEEDSTADGPWGHIRTQDEGDTWEEYQDDGTFPSWV